MKKFMMILCSAMFLISGCTQKEDKNVDLATLVDPIVSELQSLGYASPIILSDTEITTSYSITLDGDVSQAYVIKSSNEVSPVEVAMFKAQDGKLDVVKEKVAKHISDETSSWITYLPNEAQLIKDHKIYSYGNYYFLIITKDNAAILDVIKPYFK